MIGFTATATPATFPAVWRAIISSRNGMVGENMERRLGRVAAAARRQVGVETGALRESIGYTWRPTLLGQTWTMVATDPKAYMHHEGTRPHWIVPQTAQALRFRGNGGRMVYAARVLHPGTRPNRFLSDNLHWAAG